ncbi:MAG: hypothetical protein KDD25_09280 [Bdellovibrionales bacterium]|nr:hypothetical protein [Bdellovibrionales bacterium]
MSSGAFLMAFVAALVAQHPKRPASGKFRELASVPTNNQFNYAGLAGGSLNVALKKHLLEETQMVVENDRVGVEFKEFMISKSQNAAQNVCGVYENVRIRFVARGIASSGEPPQIVVEAPCRVSSNDASVGPIWVPTQYLLENHPKVDEDLVYEYSDQLIQVKNLDGYWPEEWVLDEIEVFSSLDKKESFQLSFGENHRGRTHPLTFTLR